MSHLAVPSGDGHGIADWPSARRAEEPLPDDLPDGRPWPAVAVVLTVAEDAEPDEGSLTSVAGQGYPNLGLSILGGAARSSESAGATSLEPGFDYVLWLRNGDLLAPGALVALVVEAVLTDAGAVAGLRLLFDGGVHGLDVLGDSDGAGNETGDQESGDVLFRTDALERVGVLSGEAAPSSSVLCARLAAANARLSRVGRPVLLVKTTGFERPTGHRLRVVSLTDVGYDGGAGIAHRRLAEAMAMAGHYIEHIALSAESPPAAAEWTDRFPRTEAAIVGGRYDVVLAGNLHRVTRGGGVVARLSRAVPTALALHDLFALTGRCAHPKDCRVIATGCDSRCPTPAEYPQLRPSRIAEAYREKRQALSAGEASPLLLANSEWTQARAEALAPPSAPIARIQLAFPAGIFRPMDRAQVRRALGLPEHDILILFAAVIADAPDKGFDDLVATMARVAHPGVGFVAVGRLDDPGVFGLSNLHAPGPIGDEERLAQWYAACDIYLTASRLETLGQTPIEAGLCGTPTVAYRATGLTSAVIDGVTGILVDPRQDALAEGVERLIVDGELRRRLGAFARIVLESRFSHAASAISLTRALADWPGMDAMRRETRIGFAPEILGHFAFAARRAPGATGLVARPSHPLFRGLRRVKHALLGRGMPLWGRQALYLASLLRRRLAR